MLLSDPFATAVALAPVAIYLLVISVARLRGRGRVTTSNREAIGLGMAVSGFAAVGPAQLFFPQAAAAWFDWKVWLMLAAFYVLLVLLVSLNVRPKLSITGRDSGQVFAAVARAAGSMDPAARIDEGHGEIELPTESVRLRLTPVPGVDHVEVVSFEPNLSVRFWQRLESALRHQLRQAPTEAMRRGWGTLTAGLGLSLWIGVQILRDPNRFAAGFWEWLLHR